MPRYSFRCERCNIEFEEKMSLRDYTPVVCCPRCEHSDEVHRNYFADGVTFIPPTQTLGSAADRNTSKMSNDEKLHLYKKHNEYKEKGFSRANKNE